MHSFMAIECSFLQSAVNDFSSLTCSFFYRISLGSSNSLLRGILHMGMGQSPTNHPHVLHELRLITRRLLPHSNLQHRGIPANRHKSRSSLHRLGFPSEAAPSISYHEGLQQDGKQQLPLCQKVPQGRPDPRQDRPRATRPPNRPVLSRGVVRGKLGRRGRPLLDKGRRLGVQTGARRREDAGVG